MLYSLIKDHKVTFSRFILVGGISTVINYVMFYVLYKVLAMNYLTSSSAGYLAGTVLGFVLNKVFTFESKETSYKIEIIKYSIVYTISLLFGLLILQQLVKFGIPVYLANIFIIGFTTITNYVGTRYLVFSKTDILKKLDFLLFRHRYLLTYIIIGLASIFLEIIVIFILNNFYIKGFIAEFGGFIVGMIFSFVLNSQLNFKVPKNQSYRNFSIFAVISLFSYSLNLILLSILFSNFTLKDYSIARAISAGCIFYISYFLHRRITFRDTKEVGIAVYLSKDEDIKNIYGKVGPYPDYIHVDLVDKSFNSLAKEIDISKLSQIKQAWPKHMVMVHIMSKNPSFWIDKIANLSDYIIIHVEIAEDIRTIIQKTRKLGKKTGVSILPHTNLNSISAEVFSKLDIVQILGIDNPGRSGQMLSFESINNLEKLKRLKKKYHFSIGFDGGVKVLNIDKIDAKYIVSSSTVMNSSNPKMSLYNLKTSSRYLQVNSVLKSDIKSKILGILSKNESVLSGTVVGSFFDKKGIEGINDIDIVAIVEKLNKGVFDNLVEEFSELGRFIQKTYGYDFLINSTLGPIKYNRKNLIVFHLMIYDKHEHKDHCIKSPFTCLDWQRSQLFVKKRMGDIFGLNNLSPNFFFNSRRGIREYISDLEREEISFREYSFENKKTLQVLKSKQMNNRDKFEFSYHILKFCIFNFIKLVSHRNFAFDSAETTKKYFNLFPINKKKYLSLLKSIEGYKANHLFPPWNNNYFDTVKCFLQDFDKQFSEYFSKSKKIYFIRHQKTAMNVGDLFIGQRSNPEILPIKESDYEAIRKIVSSEKFNVYSSQSKRAIQTAEKFFESSKVNRNALLNEIDYGLVDGKNLEFLKNKWPEIIKEWSLGNDPRFPEGENYSDLRKRFKYFLDLLSKKDENAIVFTHNVFLRCLIGEFFKIPNNKWHMIRIPHVEPMQVLLLRRHFYINVTQDQLKEMFKDL